MESKKRKKLSRVIDDDLPKGEDVANDNDTDTIDKENTESNSNSKSNLESNSKSNQQSANSNSKSNQRNVPTPANTNTKTSTAATMIRKPVNAPGKAAEAGVILKVYVENFMCHKKLSIDLCRNVNFIHGQNGSGKSAVLAAIQICLGAGARRTHRARNLKDLVRKESSSSAKVRVTLLNQGADGYQRDVYGGTITVERSISIHGGYNGYRLLDQNQKEQSKSKRDLDAMLDQLNIQVENPVAVLDQEEAKKFLTGKPQDKYNFFMKATELERIDCSYAAVIDNIATLRDTSDRAQQQIAGAVTNVKALKHEWEQFQQLDKLQDKLTDAHIDHNWAFYNDCDQKLQSQQQQLQVLQAKQEKREQELANAHTNSQTEGDEEQTKKERMGELTEEAKTASKLKRELETELKVAQAPQKNKRREIQQINQAQEKSLVRLNQAKGHLQDVREQIVQHAGNQETRERQRTEQLTQAEVKLEQERQKIPAQKQSINENHQKYEEIEPHVEQAKQNTKQAEQAILTNTQTLHELNSANHNSMAMFGQKCVKVHQLVQQANQRGKFQGKVIGPIGAYIKVAEGKEHFASIAEKALNTNNLDKFILTNSRDRALFTQLRQQASCRFHECGFFQVKIAQRYPILPPPVQGIETVASVLSIDDDLVFNCLVDNMSMDQMALAENKEESERLLLQEDAQGRFTIRGNNIRLVHFLPDGDTWQVRNGSKSTNSNERKMKQTIGVDKTAALEQASSETPSLKQKLLECRHKEAEIKHQEKNYKVAWNKENQQNRETMKLIQELEQSIEEIRNEAEQVETNPEFDTTEYEEDVSNNEHTVEQLGIRRTAAQQELDGLEPNIESILLRLEEVTERNERVICDLEAAENDLEMYLNTLTQRQAHLDKKRAKLEQMLEIIEKQTEKVLQSTVDRDDGLRRARRLVFERNRNQQRKAEHENESEETLSLTAEEMTQEPTAEELEAIEPTATRRDQEYYRAKIDRAKNKIVEEKKRRCLTESDPDVAYEKYMRANKNLKSKTDAIEEINGNIENLTHDMKDRRRRWKQFRSHIVVMTNSSFDEMLQKKGSAGELEFNHEEGSLNLCVQKNNHDESSQTNDVKSLSGGERSYTTLSLLVALGEHLETPFRVMDEFDVFLDPVARKIALETLILVGKTMEHRQFIFITPQDLSSLKTDPMLKIFTMKPPSRGSTVGGPSQQTLDFTQ